MATNIKTSTTIPVIRRKAQLAKDTKRTQLLRTMMQVGFVTIISYHIIGSRLIDENSSAAITNPEAYCPFGGVETLYQYFSTGGRFVPHTHISNLVILIAVLGITLVAKSAFCGWICPLGSIQEWLYKFRRLFYKKELPLKFPAWLDKYARYFKYVILAWLLYETVRIGKMVFRDYDPYSAILSIGKEVAIGGLIILISTLVLSLVVDRPWCRYACPLGATIGIVGRASLFKIRRDENTCFKGCTLCNRACPSGIEVKKLKTIASTDCINCMSCVAGCPTNALALRLPELALAAKKPELKQEV
jgi:polyferredoxin